MRLGTFGVAALASLAAAKSPKAGKPKRVAIIGAGAGGASTAYHLAQNADSANIPIIIDVFERSSHVGGRSTTINAWSSPLYPVELGASIFVSVNHILANATREFGLRTASHNIHDDEKMPDLGIWDGQKFVYTMTDEGGWWDMAKLFWRYGYAPVKTNGLMKETVGKFLSMYEGPLFPWKSLSQVVQDVGLVEVTGLTGEQFLKNNGVGDKFAQEIIQASTRVNYASNLGMLHGVETMVCMAANGAMSIDGGNWQIFDRMLKSHTSIATHLNFTIASISKQEDGRYNITDSEGTYLTYDEVVLASPLQFSNLNIDPKPKHTPDEIPYVKLWVTHFATPLKLSPSAFGLKEDEEVPQAVLTTIPADEPYTNGTAGSPGFFSISIVASGVNPLSTVPRLEYVYKIFSDHRIDAAFLSKYLGVPITSEEIATGAPDGNVTWINHKLFHSYPQEYPRLTFDEMKLDEGLWYTSAIESFISTMETSALAGKNVARLIVDEWETGAKGEDEMKDEDEDEGEWRFEEVIKEQRMGQQPQRPLKAKL